jgi:hypothetical protein
MRHLLFFVFLLAVLVSNGQPPIAKEWRNLIDRINYQLHYNDSVGTEEYKAEYILCMFKVDSVGKITGVNYLADPQNIGTIYKALSSIPLAVFESWEYKKSKAHTVILPIVYCPEEGCPEYFNDLINSRGDKSVFWKPLNETATTILFTPYRIFRPKPRS